MVPVYATVRGPDGRLVTDLEKDAFEIFDNGAAVDITLFRRDAEPLTVAVMIDTSWSMTRPAIWDVRQGVLAFFQTLTPGDRASLGTFGAQIAVGPRLTNDIAEFSRVLAEEVWVGGGTPFWQALSESIESIAKEPNRRVVLVYSDGLDSGSLPNWNGNRSRVFREAIEADCLVYVVRPDLRAPDERRSREAILPLLDATGGGYLDLSVSRDMVGTFSRVAEELRHQYQLGFVPNVHDGKVHRIEVRLRGGGLTAQARKAYLAEKR